VVRRAASPALAFLAEQPRETALAELSKPYRAARFVADETGAQALVDSHFFAPLLGAAIDAPLKLLLGRHAVPAQGLGGAASRCRRAASSPTSRSPRTVCKRARRARARRQWRWAPNLISYLRALPPASSAATGAFGNYRWGSGTKTLLLGAEAGAHRHDAKSAEKTRPWRERAA